MNFENPVYKKVLENNVVLDEQLFESDTDKAINELISEQNMALFGTSQRIRRNKKICEVSNLKMNVLICFFTNF